MTVRSTMADLISRTRTLIADPNQAAFTDQQVQDALDFRRVEHRQQLLESLPTFQPSGTILFLDFYSDVGNWEGDVKLQDASWQDITSQATAEYIVGHWSFPTQPNGIAVRATGKTYDIYGAAADLLESWAAQVKLDFSYTADRDAYARNQKFQMLTSLAADYRARALPQTSRITQSDLTPDYDGGGVTYPSYGGAEGW